MHRGLRQEGGVGRRRHGEVGAGMKVGGVEQKGLEVGVSNPSGGQMKGEVSVGVKMGMVETGLEDGVKEGEVGVGVEERRGLEDGARHPGGSQRKEEVGVGTEERRDSEDGVRKGEAGAGMEGTKSLEHPSGRQRKGDKGVTRRRSPVGWVGAVPNRKEGDGDCALADLLFI